MNMKPTQFAALTLTAVLVGMGLGAVLHGSLHPAPPHDTRLRDYCSQVHAGMMIDVTDLESGDLKRQREASDHFSEPYTFHSQHEIKMCGGPIDLRTHDDCWLRQDFACLATLAKQAEKATRQDR